MGSLITHFTMGFVSNERCPVIRGHHWSLSNKGHPRCQPQGRLWASSCRTRVHLRRFSESLNPSTAHQSFPDIASDTPLLCLRLKRVHGDSSPSPGLDILQTR